MPLRFPPKRALSAKLGVPDMGPVIALLRRDLARLVREVAEGEEPRVRAKLLDVASIFEEQTDLPTPEEPAHVVVPLKPRT